MADGAVQGKRGNVQEDALDALIEPEWKPAIKVNLAVTFQLADMVAEFELPDEAEPAPVFEA
jgi:hypothetical protein